MFRCVGVLLTLLVLQIGFTPAGAWADSEHTCQGNSCNGGSTNTVTSTNTNVNANNLSNHQGQGQSQGQSQRQSVRNSGNNVGTSSVSVNEGDTPRQAPPAIAPHLTTAPETCMGSTAIGASSPFGGVSAGWTWKSEPCETRMKSRRLQELGFLEESIAIMVTDEEVAKAFKATGRKVPGMVETVTPNRVVEATQAVSYPAYPQGSN